MEVRISFFNVVGERKTNNGHGNWNFVFQKRGKTKNENKSPRKTESGNGSLNSVQSEDGVNGKRKWQFQFAGQRLTLGYTH